MKKLIFFLVLLTALNPSAWSAPQANDYIVAGNKLATEKKYGEAIEQYQKAAELEPKNGRVHLLLCLAQAQIGAWDEALEACQSAVKTEPSYTAYYNLALIYASKQETERSLDAFDRALALNPESEEALYRRGLVYYSTDDYGRAIDSYKKVLKLNPQFDEARIGLVGAYLKQDNRTAAMEEIEEFRKMKKNEFADLLEARIQEGASS